MILHARFREETLPVVPGEGESLEIELTPKQEVYEEIVVSAARAGDTFTPVALTSTAVTPEERVEPPSTLLDVVDGVPGVPGPGVA